MIDKQTTLKQMKKSYNQGPIIVQSPEIVSHLIMVQHTIV